MDRKPLIDAARAAAALAHAPYSKFTVGAALRCNDGEVYTGCNVENASYGLTVCAERVAIWKAVSAGRMHFTDLAIVAPAGDSLPYPCGACRQVMAEFGPAGLRIHIAPLDAHDDRVESCVLDELLPHRFEFDGE